MKLSEITIGHLYEISAPAVRRACQMRGVSEEEETALLEWSGGDLVVSIRGLFAIVNPVRFLERLILDGPSGFRVLLSDERCAVVRALGTGEPYRKRMDGVRVEADAPGWPGGPAVTLLVHASALEAPGTFAMRAETSQGEWIARREAAQDAELRRLLDDEDGAR